MLEPRTPVMILVEASWEDQNGTPRVVPAQMEDKSDGGACISVNTPIEVGTQLRIQWRWEKFTGVAKYCRREGREYFVGIQRDKAKAPPFQEAFSADFPRPEEVASSARLIPPSPLGIIPKPPSRPAREIPVPDIKKEIPIAERKMETTAQERKVERVEKVENVNVVFIVNCAPPLPPPPVAQETPKRESLVQEKLRREPPEQKPPERKQLAQKQPDQRQLEKRNSSDRPRISTAPIVPVETASAQIAPPQMARS